MSEESKSNQNESNNNPPSQENNNTTEKVPKQGTDSIKELKMKLKALTQCLIEERNKNSEIVVRLKELEDAVEGTVSRIDNLTKERYEMQSELSRNRTLQEDGDKKVKDVVNKLFNKEKINFDKFDEVKEAIEILKFENKKLQQKYLETTEQYDEQKIKFATILQVEANKTIDLKQKVEKSKKDLENYVSQDGVKQGLELEYKENFEKYKSEIAKIKDEKKIIDADLQVVKKEKIAEQGKAELSDGTISDLRNQIFQQNKKIDSLKELTKPKKLECIVFNTESIEGMFLNSDDSSSKIIRFYKNQDNKDIIIEIGGRPFKITDTKIIPTKSTSKKIQIEIINSFKPVVNIDELISDYFLHIYDEYYEKAVAKE